MAVLERQVDDGDLRFNLLDLAEGLHPGAGLPADLHVDDAVDSSPDRVSDRRMVIDEVDADVAGAAIFGSHEDRIVKTDKGRCMGRPPDQACLLDTHRIGRKSRGIKTDALVFFRSNN